MNVRRGERVSPAAAHFAYFIIREYAAEGPLLPQRADHGALANSRMVATYHSDHDQILCCLAEETVRDVSLTDL